MKLNRLVALAAIAVLVVVTMSIIAVQVFAQAGDSSAQESDDDGEDGDGAEDEAEGPDVPITGSALDTASAAALEALGEGRVTDTEVGDEEGYYEIEVTLDDGRQVDVHLDENFNLLSQEYD